MNKMLTLLALLLAIGTTACNTVEGAGEDIEAAGEAIEDAAEDAKR
jgi:predicted small secreted protein